MFGRTGYGLNDQLIKGRCTCLWVELVIPRIVQCDARDWSDLKQQTPWLYSTVEGYGTMVHEPEGCLPEKTSVGAPKSLIESAALTSRNRIFGF